MLSNCPLSGRGQGQVANFRISHPWNIFETAKASVVKFCVLAGYINC